MSLPKKCLVDTNVPKTANLATLMQYTCPSMLTCDRPGEACDKAATRFVTTSCDKAMTRTVTSWGILAATERDFLKGII